MTDPTLDPHDPAFLGWKVTDPDGNVVSSGPQTDVALQLADPEGT